MKEDGFEAQRALTREFREALDAFSEDARRLVKEEVARGTSATDDWAALARRVAAEEIKSSAQRKAVSWPTAWAGAGLAVGVVAVVLMVGRVVGGVGVVGGSTPGDSGIPAAVAAPAPGSENPAGSEADSAHPAWVRFDSLVEARDSAFLGLVQDAASLDSATAALVSDWWAATGPPSDAALDALVRLALRQWGDSSAVGGPVSPDLMARLLVLRAVESP